MRPILIIFGFYAYLFQALLGGALAGEAATDFGHAPVCRHQTLPTPPDHGSHQRHGACCTLACRTGVASLRPTGAALPHRVAVVVRRADPPGETSTGARFPAPQNARGPPAFV